MNANAHLQAVGPAAFKLWIYLCRQAQAQEAPEFSVALSVLARDAGVVSEQGGDGLGPVRAAMRRLVAAGYVRTVPEKERRCRIELLKTVDIRPAAG